MEVANLLTQLQKALTKPETCSVQTQTNDSYENYDQSTWDIFLDAMTAQLESTRDSTRKKRKIESGKAAKQALHTCPKCNLVSAYFESQLKEKFGIKSNGKHQSWCKGCRDVLPIVAAPMRTVAQKEPSVQTPEPLSLQLPPSTSVDSCITDKQFADNISDAFDENDHMDPEEPYPEEHLEDPGDEIVYVPSPATTRMGKKELHDCRVFNEDTSIINRKGSIFCISSHGSNGMEFHDTIRKSSESWRQAEERHRMKSHPIVKKRAKLLSILSTQEKQPMHAIMKKYEGVTTVELFCRIKQESPALLKPLATE